MKQEKNEYAVAAFHKRNLEMIRAVIQTVEDLDVPVIPQHVEVNDNLLLWKKLARLCDYDRLRQKEQCASSCSFRSRKKY